MTNPAQEKPCHPERRRASFERRSQRTCGRFAIACSCVRPQIIRHLDRRRRTFAAAMERPPHFAFALISPPAEPAHSKPPPPHGRSLQPTRPARSPQSNDAPSPPPGLAYAQLRSVSPTHSPPPPPLRNAPKDRSRKASSAHAPETTSAQIAADRPGPQSAADSRTHPAENPPPPAAKRSPQDSEHRSHQYATTYGWE